MTLSIRDIQLGLRYKQFSAGELARRTLARIAQDDPQINAFTDVTEARMLAEAARIDALIAAGERLPPLAGVPYAVKNLFDIEGVTTLAGAELFSKAPPAAADAFAVGQLSQAGATLAGAVNMDAYAYGFTTENSHYGATRNPRDLARIAGGSSGGSAAAVAARLVNFALGTDTNGSIRVPSSLCGVLGLKPTFGRLSRSGSHPFVASLDHIGPLARFVDDLARVYDVMQGRDPTDRWQQQRDPCPAAATLEQGAPLRCAALGGWFDTWSSAEARDAVARAGRALGADRQLELPEAALARSAAFLLTAAEGGNHYLPALRAEPERFEPNSRERLLAGCMTPAAWYNQAQRFRAWFRDRVLPLFDDVDLLIAPATPCCATPIGQESIRLNGADLPTKASMGMLAQPISFLGLPVVTVPLKSRSGLPIGVQLIGAPWQEARCLQAAWRLEQAGVLYQQENI
ncbi:AtzE family amidohydrolase [Pluralibacter gergoviae]|uniref:AtzE family amidohydrolase n=1 Tax=Pluralibacter gergoviae TaxID=61647 RepID=UPI000BFB6DD2|nr:AtzE family amidohydrolase [Pluralibacter gergoviae]MCK1068713.1 AtzE family amidohydrolase [Pluralibacter gergoviae]MCV7757248.1 AtzE family amidohydrolase [Pluralibacter gergoviae]PHH48725.1 Asp-tRNA(Asn)/Glu-tRNA(Gln) amidotransferase GatCAB subunit A [Pluralibacter gergoviae]HDS1238189.1 AtzE family amidohydrolase [Pluralibacter gergoviae]HDS1243763.1 AtzE family amidohydrolase [Pluralibacter gergoviae]